MQNCCMFLADDSGMYSRIAFRSKNSGSAALIRQLLASDDSDSAALIRQLFASEE